MVQFDHIQKTYQSPNGEIRALEDVTFSVAEGDFVSIVGPSGCGKSTLLSIAVGLEDASGGTVLLKGRPAAENLQRIGYMPQRDELFPWRTIWANVTLGLELRGQKDDIHTARVAELLDRYGLAGFREKLPGQLSGGMRQRCALIRTLATDPELLLLDEPFSALDYQTRLQVSDDIHAMIRREGKTGSRPWSGGGIPASRSTSIPYGRSWITMAEPLSSARQAYLRRLGREKRRVTLAQILLLLGFFALWELAARAGWIDSFLLSSPSRIWETLAGLWSSGDLWLHLGTSCWETVAGFMLGTAVGAVIAVLLWLCPGLYRVVEPYLVVLSALPKTALGPVFIVWIGAGPASIIAMTLAISLIVTILEVHNGFLATDPGKLRLMRTMGASRSQILWKLVLPANFGTFINALKVNVGLSWVGVIMGEFLVSRAGLGYLIVYGSQVFQMDLVMASVLLLAVVAAVMYQGIRLLERSVHHHREGST